MTKNGSDSHVRKCKPTSPSKSSARVMRNEAEMADTEFQRVYNQLRRDKQELVV